jgi:hypothetical protein
VCGLSAEYISVARQEFGYGFEIQSVIPAGSSACVSLDTSSRPRRESNETKGDDLKAHACKPITRRSQGRIARRQMARLIPNDETQPLHSMNVKPFLMKLFRAKSVLLNNSDVFSMPNLEADAPCIKLSRLWVNY